MNFETVIGLEVHVQLKTRTKIFCNCSTDYANQPANSHVCSVCLGHPGVLPVLNREVLNHAVLASLALNCTVATLTRFDRKHYFYPDLPKNYQISQYDQPIGQNGYLIVEPEGQEPLKVRILRAHMEEDAGKSMHTESKHSLLDFNRAGIPLLEIVSEPDIRSAEEARAYLDKLKITLQYIGVSDCDMENGTLRCDVNLSVRPFGQAKYGTRVEIKNLNSFRSVVRAIEYESQRHREMIEDGERIIQATLLWDEAQGQTRMMRSKENTDDYRYFPEPDLLPFQIRPEEIEKIRLTLPELADARQSRFMSQYGLSAYNARLLSESRTLAEYFEEAVSNHANPVAISNWMLTELLREMNRAQKTIDSILIRPANLASLVYLIDQNIISGRIAKNLFEQMFEKGGDPAQMVKDQGLLQISEDGPIEEAVRLALSKNTPSLNDLKAGRFKAYGYLVGQVMRELKGKGNPARVNQLLLSILKSDHQIEIPV